MRVFVTGATGFIGSAVVKELIAAGHQVLGLTRSDEGAKALIAAGAEVHQGTLENLESLHSGAAVCDGVIHTAYNNDFSQFAEAGEMDRKAVEVLGTALAGSARPLVITSAIGVLAHGRPTTEEDAGDPNGSGAVRIPSEEKALEWSSKGVRSSIIRLPLMVHDQTKQGLATRLTGLAQQKGVSAYIDEGLNCWPAVHRLDAARLFRLALEAGTAGSRYHAIAENKIQLREIAEAIGRKLHVPVAAIPADKAADHFGFLTYFVNADFQASSTRTREALAWQPTRSGVITDLAPNA